MRPRMALEAEPNEETPGAPRGRFGHELSPDGPQPQPEAGEVDPLAGLGVVEIAAVEADAEVDPDRGDIAGVVVAVLVGVPFDEPTVDALLLAGAGDFLLPALEQARHV